MRGIRFSVAVAAIFSMFASFGAVPASAAVVKTDLVATWVGGPISTLYTNPVDVVTDDTYAYVSNSTSGSASAVYVFDQQTMTLAKTFSGSTLGFSYPTNLLIDGNNLWVTCMTGSPLAASLVEIDVTTGTVIRTLTGSDYGNGIRFAKMLIVGDNIWVAEYGGGSIEVINRTTGALVRKISGSSYQLGSVTGIAYDGTNVWLTSYYPTSLVTIIKASDYSLVQVLSASSYKFDQPWGIAFDGTSMWIASYYEGVDQINISDFSVTNYVSNTLIYGTQDLEYYNGKIYALHQAASLVSGNWGPHFSVIDPATATIVEEMWVMGTGGFDASGNRVSFTPNGIFGVSPSPRFINRLRPSSPPGASDAPTAVGGNGSATVTWSAPAQSGSSAITGYYVTSSPAGGTCYTSSTSCTISGLTNGTAYTFKVTAYNGQGAGTPSASSNSVTPSGPPSAPTNLAGTSGDGSVTLTWSAPSSNGGSAITGYTVTASPGGATCQTTNLTCAVSGLTNGTSYTFTVTATNAIGTSSASTSVTLSPRPPAPSSTSAPVVADTTVSNRFASGDTLSLTDGAWANATGSFTYSWYRCPSSTFSSTDCTLISGEAGSTYELKGADIGSYVFGVVTASNADGATTSTPSNSAGIVVGPASNDAVPSLINTTRSGSIRVGDTILLTDGAWSNASGSLSYSWYSCTASDAIDPPTSPTCALIAGATSGSWTVSSAMVGHYVYGVVTASGSDGSTTSAVATALPYSVVDVPSAPTVVAVQPNASGNSALVTVGASVSTGGSAISGYVVYAYDASGQQVGTCTAATNGCTIKGLTPGATYTFRALATNSIGNSPLSSSRSAVMIATYAKVNAYIRGYAFAQSDLTSTMFGQIRATVRRIVAGNNTRITITGFANFKATKRLSRDRANNVADYVRSQLLKAGRTDISVTIVVGGNTSKFGGAVLNRVVVIQGR